MTNAQSMTRRRLICSVVVLLPSVNLACAEEGRPAPDTTRLTQEEIEQGVASLFDGKTLKGWQGWLGGLDDHVVENGVLVYEKGGTKGNLYTIKEDSDFLFRLDIKLVPGGNHGEGIHAPLKARPHLADVESRSSTYHLRCSGGGNMKAETGKIIASVFALELTLAVGVSSKACDTWVRP